MFGLFSASLIFGLEWQAQTSLSYSSTLWVGFGGKEPTLLANDVATLFMFVVISAGFGWVLYRAHYLNISHLHPSQVKKHLLAKNEALLVDTYEIYHQAAVWLSLNWLAFLTASLDFFAGNLSLFVFALSIGVTLTLLFSLATNVSKELKLAR